MLKSEKLNWTIAIVGLVASLISIFAFLTGAQSIPGIVNKPAPRQVVEAPKAPDAPKTTPIEEPKKDKTIGHVVTAPVASVINGVSRALTLPKHAKKPDEVKVDPQKTPDQPAPEKK